jgi:hypothetical protein
MGYWDGHGKLTVHLFRSFFDRMRALGLSTLDVADERYYDMGTRVEFSADVRAEMLGNELQGNLFLAHEYMGYICVLGIARRDRLDDCKEITRKIKDSVTIGKDWVEAVASENWVTMRFEAARATCRVPRWWTPRDLGNPSGRVFTSPGWSGLFLDSFVSPGPSPDMAMINRILNMVELPGYSRMAVVSEEDLRLRYKEGVKFVLEAKFRKFEMDLDVKGVMVFVRSEDRWVLLIFFSPGPYVDRQEVVVDKVIESIDFD